MTKNKSKQFDKTVFLLHGGGALGAYQVGVYKELAKEGFSPDWMIGTSIGAMNSAIIAGNPPEKRVEMLEAFWETISTPMPEIPDMLNNLYWERCQNYLSALGTAVFGQPGFFMPRPANPWLGSLSTVDQLSYYRTDALRNTLKSVVNLDYLNEKHVRLSMGAVHVATGSLVYFDNTRIPITIDHIMASGALPPGFPSICIDDQYYWDGGVHSNTQLNLLLMEKEPIRYLVFMVHLFDSFGIRPTCMDDVLKRQKDITYSSHHRKSIQVYKNVHNLRHAIRALGERLSPEERNNPEVKELLDLGRAGILHLARFHYKGSLSDLSTKDYDFSSPAIEKHIRNGWEDVRRALVDPPWDHEVDEGIGLILYEFSDHPADDSPFEEHSHYYTIT